MNKQSILNAIFFSLFLGCAIYNPCIAQLSPAERARWEFEMEGENGLKVGESYPMDTFYTLNRKAVCFSDQNFDLTVVNFWFKACPGCKMEKPFLKQLPERLNSNEKIRFISITLDNEKVAKKYVQENGTFGFEIISLSKSDIKKMFNIGLFPANLVLDRNGKVLGNYHTSIASDLLLNEYVNRIKSFIE
jgi:thiol-disulfide isomerase/thioredoxin